MGKLTTHVLDTARGVPAKGIKISLYRIGDDGLQPLVSTVTNDDGRTHAPLLIDDDCAPGLYQLVFSTAAYFRSTNTPLEPIPFLDDIVIRFGVSDATKHFHVPLLVSPYGYSTYRGS
ncbi:hydroxyisourate hydrolase [Enterovibrio norvegicus FF-33]|uniref:hydroxyisourate hydrolase n=1 Tax=Enterovibrio norvegicus TaxID=188144 RepID=UPI0002FCF38B|nr:hydroxyisourate hydrolase [Enterovibrio norvegicus]OEE66059.1 hydroxyisourate hydrolase [Enterovibrio norvegicus FF-33]OEE88522.1 hydroxyisourate hydrolase [Enterovibrio norvegicus FF-162]